MTVLALTLSHPPWMNSWHIFTNHSALRFFLYVTCLDELFANQYFWSTCTHWRSLILRGHWILGLSDRGVTGWGGHWNLRHRDISERSNFRAIKFPVAPALYIQWGIHRESKGNHCYQFCQLDSHSSHDYTIAFFVAVLAKQEPAPGTIKT